MYSQQLYLMNLMLPIISEYRRIRLSFWMLIYRSISLFFFPRRICTKIKQHRKKIDKMLIHPNWKIKIITVEIILIGEPKDVKIYKPLASTKLKSLDDIPVKIAKRYAFRVNWEEPLSSTVLRRIWNKTIAEIKVIASKSKKKKIVWSLSHFSL